ncbi:hypothetical protein JPM7_2980 [Metamycoplasma equirhinis]|uniref:hypothetical protein n=1 Tax=Metamycoplasma equirhinis TaxID=92402 RepID=UPI002572D966|nr:hypothetical protein [Metamycoplasma equirhinis]BDX52691.1 hypothetical protein JPM7_2980 [Metamycoplasma equirhinis]
MRKSKILTIGIVTALAATTAGIAISIPFIWKSKRKNDSKQKIDNKLEDKKEKTELDKFLEERKAVLLKNISELAKDKNLTNAQIQTLSSQNFKEIIFNLTDATIMQLKYVFNKLKINENILVNFCNDFYLKNNSTLKYADILQNKFTSYITEEKLTFEDNKYYETLKYAANWFFNYINLEELFKSNSELLESYKQNNFDNETKKILYITIWDIISNELQYERGSNTWGGGFSKSFIEFDSNGLPKPESIAKNQAYLEKLGGVIDSSLNVNNNSKFGSKLLNWLLNLFKNYPNSLNKDKNLNKENDFDYFPVFQKWDSFWKSGDKLYEEMILSVKNEQKTVEYADKILGNFAEGLSEYYNYKSNNQTEKMADLKFKLKENLNLVIEIYEIISKSNDIPSETKEAWENKIVKISDSYGEILKELSPND